MTTTTFILENNVMPISEEIADALNIVIGDYIQFTITEDKKLHVTKYEGEVTPEILLENENIVQVMELSDDQMKELIGYRQENSGFNFQTRCDVINHLKSLEDEKVKAENFLVDYQKMLSLEHPLHILTGRTFTAYTVESNEVEEGKLSKSCYLSEQGYSELRHFDKVNGLKLVKLLEAMPEVDLDFTSLKQYNERGNYLILVKYKEVEEETDSILDLPIEEYVIVNLD